MQGAALSASRGSRLREVRRDWTGACTRVEPRLGGLDELLHGCSLSFSFGRWFDSDSSYRWGSCPSGETGYVDGRKIEASD